MSPKLMEAASHRIGTMRFGRHAIPGQGRLADAIGKLAARFGGSRGVASPWPGVQFEANLNDRIQRQMWAGVYEPHVRECFAGLIEPGDVYMDVGAHIGFHAVFAAHRVGVGGRVFAFEADPMVKDWLSRNLAQFPWAQAVHAAVWDHSGSISFERSSFVEESGWGTVCDVRDLGKGEHTSVAAISLDDWCRESRTERLDAVKIDAEGSELAVLHGGQSSIERFRPAIIVEINGILLEGAGASAAEVAEFLVARGYRLYPLSFRRLRHWEASLDSEFSDTLCVPEEQARNICAQLSRAGFEVPD